MKHAILFLSSFILLGTAAAQHEVSDPAGLAWTLQETDGSLGFADLAQHGTLAWCSTSDNATGAMLLSRFDTSPPAPLWMIQTPGAEVLSSDGAREGDVCASISRINVGGINDFRYTLRVGSSQGLRWTYDYPVITTFWSRVCVSRDGNRIVAVFVDDEAPATDILLFSAGSPVPQQAWSLPAGVPWAAEVADDGSRLALSLEQQILVVDLATGATLFSFLDPYYVSNRTVALSGDGRTLAFSADGYVQLHRWNGTAYELVHAQPIPSGGSVQERSIALSRDGNTCAWGVSFFTDPVPSTEVWTQCLDVPTHALTMTEKVSSWGSYQNSCTDIELSDDGGIIAVVQAGDEPDVVAELRVFEREQSVPIYTLNLPGSALDVDVSSDGRWILVGSRSTHVHSAGVGGRVDLIHLAGDELEWHGVPALGQAAELIVHGQAGQLAGLLYGKHLDDAPLAVGQAGLLWLDPLALRLFGLFPIGASGTAEVSFHVPVNPALTGITLDLQAFCSPPDHLTSNWLPVTIVP